MEEDCFLCALLEAEQEGSRAVPVDRNGQLVLPYKFRRELGAGRGGVVFVQRTPQGTFELVPLRTAPRKARPGKKRRARVARKSKDPVENIDAMTPPLRFPN